MIFVYNFKNHRIWHQNCFVDAVESKNKVSEGTQCLGFQWIMYYTSVSKKQASKIIF